MREGNSIIGGARRAASIWLAAFFGFSMNSACAALAAEPRQGPRAVRRSRGDSTENS